MRKIDLFLTVLILICMMGFSITVGLSLYHYSFDPYSWLEAGKGSVESRDLWNLRKDLYHWWMLNFLVGSILSVILLTFNWLIKGKSYT